MAHAHKQQQQFTMTEVIICTILHGQKQRSMSQMFVLKVMWKKRTQVKITSLK